MSGRPSQVTDTVLMVRPSAFGSNPETAASNAFQHALDRPADEVQAAALAETDALIEALNRAGVRVVAVDDSPEPVTPDAVFPNNWLATDAHGRVWLFPMQSPVRRQERRSDIVDRLAREFVVREIVDLSAAEDQSWFLEGTGSLVWDRAHGEVYAALSPRTDPELVAAFGVRADALARTFTAADPAGVPVYHTNVVLSIGEGFAAVGLDWVPEAQRARLTASLRETGHRVLELDGDQIYAFAGNLLHLATRDGGRVIAMSAAAWGALREGQRRTLEAFGEIVAVPLPTIERFGGGSARCMLAEVFLPPLPA